MRGRRRTALAATLPLLWLGAGGVVEPAPPPGNGPPFRLILPPRVELEPITVHELLGPGFGSPVPFDGIEAPLLTPATVVREIPELWRMRLPPGQAGRPFQVSYDIVGANGVTGFLSLPADPAAMMLIRTETLVPQPTGDGNGAAMIRGGIRMFLDVSQAGRAGAYAGRLTVTVTRL